MKVAGARRAARLPAARASTSSRSQVLEPLGKGSLQQAFEELKEKLEKEGLFDPARKRPLPMLPRRIGVVTSPTGAVHPRHPARAALALREPRGARLPRARAGRGRRGRDRAGHPRAQPRSAGARRDRRWRAAAAASRTCGPSTRRRWPARSPPRAIPTISAVGHETDFTIADFVADLRAPTPSAAAERVVQAKEELAARVAGLERAARRRAAPAPRAGCGPASRRRPPHRVFAAERGRLRVPGPARRRARAAGGDGARPRRRARPRARPAPARAARGLPPRPPARRPPRAARAGTPTAWPRSSGPPPRGAAARSRARRLARRPLAARRARPRLRARLGRGAAAARPRRGRGRGGRGPAHPTPPGRARAPPSCRGRPSERRPTSPRSSRPCSSSSRSCRGSRRASCRSRSRCALYEEGIRLSRLCHAKLEEAEGRIEVLLKDARGEPVLDAQGRPRTKPLARPEDEDGR